MARVYDGLAVLAWVACAACQHDAAAPPNPAPPATASAAPADAGETVLGLADDGKTVDVARGATVTLKLELSSGTGYSWVPAPSDGGTLVPQGERTSEQSERKQGPSPMPGGPRLDVYRFAAQAPGVFPLTMELRRPWEQDTPAARVFRVTIRVR